MNISLNKIKKDDNQPRKFFDSIKLEELAESIKSIGVVQPIVVRKESDDNYVIIAGERRWRAATLAGLTTIPCIIREDPSKLIDDIIQLVENNQRENISPLEEAQAIHNLSKSLTYSEIASHLGKPTWYVNQAKTLMELLPEFQKLLVKNVISLKTALTLASLSTKIQRELYREGKDDCESDKDWYHLAKNVYNPLDKTYFPLELVAGLGSCIGCVHNSHTNCLFPDSEKRMPVCSNSSCYQKKQSKAFEHNLTTFIEDPQFLLVKHYYGDGFYKKELPDLQGKVVYEAGETVDRVSVPTKPSEIDLDPKDYQIELKEWNRKIKDINAQVKAGTLIKGLIISGKDQGKISYFRIRPSLKKSKAILANSDTPIAESDLKQEIKRIEEREERMQELDAEKVTSKIHTDIFPSLAFSKKEELLIPLEEKALIFALYDSLPYTAKKDFYKICGLKSEDDLLNDKELSPVNLRKAFRYFIEVVLNKPGGSYIKNTSCHFIFKIAQEYTLDKVNVVLEEQNKIAIQRKARCKERINNLKKKSK